jgi:hypothetical protein
LTNTKAYGKITGILGLLAYKNMVWLNSKAIKFYSTKLTTDLYYPSYLLSEISQLPSKNVITSKPEIIIQIMQTMLFTNVVVYRRTQIQNAGHLILKTTVVKLYDVNSRRKTHFPPVGVVPRLGDDFAIGAGQRIKVDLMSETFEPVFKSVQPQYVVVDLLQGLVFRVAYPPT